MNVHFLEPAEQELEEAIEYHEQQRAGLGDEFAQEVAETLQRIRNFPRAWSQLTANVRRCRLKRFSCGLVYRLRGEEILIVAVMHLHRKPGYWHDRI